MQRKRAAASRKSCRSSTSRMPICGSSAMRWRPIAPPPRIGFAARAGYTDAARIVLAQANGHVGQRGSIADYLEVAPKYERAVEACLGDLLQHVIVSTHQQAEAGIELIRQENAGRCGFLVLDAVA